MRYPEPPRVSTWLLKRLAPRYRRESLLGDLREQIHRGRSVWWYRRQVVGTILSGLAADLTAHKLLAVRALVIGWSVIYLVLQFIGPLIQQTRTMLFSRWGSALWGESEILRQLWRDYSLPFVLLWCLIFMTIGWIVTSLHRRHLPAIVLLFSATLLIPAPFLALETWRLLGMCCWGTESDRWAVVFYTLVSIVVYPLCVLIGGLCTLRTDEHDRRGDAGTVVDES